MTHFGGTLGTGAASLDNSTRPASAGQIRSFELEQFVRGIIRRRRERAKFFPNWLFADPAWEILLALTLAEQRQLRLSVSSLCDRVDVPRTTALRWIASMTEEGLLVRRDDPTDRRRKYVELSPGALASMVEYCFATAAPDRLAA